MAQYEPVPGSGQRTPIVLLFAKAIPPDRNAPELPAEFFVRRPFSTASDWLSKKSDTSEKKENHLSQALLPTIAEQACRGEPADAATTGTSACSLLQAADPL